MALTLLEVLKTENAIRSASNARRICAQGAVRLNGELCEDWDREIVSGDEIQVGKRKVFVVIESTPTQPERTEDAH
mgnify:CR=1 FL=1